MAKYKIEYVEKAEKAPRAIKTARLTTAATWFDVQDEWTKRNPGTTVVDVSRA